MFVQKERNGVNPPHASKEYSNFFPALCEHRMVENPWDLRHHGNGERLRAYYKEDKSLRATIRDKQSLCRCSGYRKSCNVSADTKQHPVLWFLVGDNKKQASMNARILASSFHLVDERCMHVCHKNTRKIHCTQFDSETGH